MQLVVDNVAKSFGVQEIFKNVSFKIDKGEKVGLVGVNGSGKTTLLRCLLDPGTVDVGTVRYAPALRLGYVEQGFANLGEESLWQYMLHCCREIIALSTKIAGLEAKAAKLAKGDELTAVLAEYAKVTALFEQADGYNYENNIKRVLIGLDFPQGYWEKSVSAFSGGQKTRILLAAALVNSPDLLILDEPTNHLDIKMTEWLEGFLSEYKGGLLVVSHDRYFLDNVVGTILEMEGGILSQYKGNYSRYLEQKAIRLTTQKNAYEAQQEYIATTEAYIRRFKAGIKSKMARGRQSQLDRLERIDAPVENEEFELRLPKAQESAEKVIMMNDLSVGYGSMTLLSGLNLTLRRGEKVALLGANGTGKTTLMRTLLQELPPLKGEAKLGNRVKIGYFSQSYERLNPRETILDNFLREYGYTDEYTRRLLGGMLFHGEEVFKEIGTLSGGQKARLVLLKLVLDGANCLLLDEPTNHLDILAKETVEAALSIYDGTVLLISHDRYLVNEIAERIWEIDDGRINDYKGNYDFFMEEKRKRAEQPMPKVKVSVQESSLKQTIPAAQIGAKEKKYSPQEAEKLLPKLELTIREYEALLKLSNEKIADPANHQTLEDSQAIYSEHEELQSKVDELMAKWEKLMECL